MKFKGLGAKQIEDYIPNDCFDGIAKDLGIQPGANIPKYLSKFANGKLTVTAKEKEEGKYYSEIVILRT
ncbi:MAG: hypothetical protein AAFR66_18940 [Bacteroidota bacterium]